jgi:hypothetical protein
MHPDHRNSQREYLAREIQELENKYAEAFADEADERSLTAVWDKIKSLRRRIESRENRDDGRSSLRQEV